MSLIDRINNAREAGVLVNVLADAKKYIDTKPKDSIDMLSSIARASLSFSHLLSSAETRFLYDLYVCTATDTVDRKADILIALSDAVGSTERGTTVSGLVDLVFRYVKSDSIPTVLSSSIDGVDEEFHLRLREFVSLLSRLPDSLISISLGSRNAHECCRRLAAAAAKGVKEGLQKAWKRLKEGREGQNDLRVISTMVTRGRNLRINEDETLISTTISFLSIQPKSPLWDEIAQALVVRGECTVLEEEQIVSAVIEQCSRVEDYKRFFGHWLGRNTSVTRACTVKYVVQRPLETVRAHALVEYVDWAGGEEILKEMTLKLLRILSTRMGARAAQRDARHRVTMIIECGRRMKMRNEAGSTSFWHDNYPMVMQATRLHIESTDQWTREAGLVVAECVTIWMNSESPLEFEYSKEGKEWIDEMRRRGRGEDEKEKKEEERSGILEGVEGVKIEEMKEEQELDSDDEIEDEKRVVIQEMDSDDTDDEVYVELQKRRKPFQKATADYESHKVHVPPSYLREALEWVVTEKEKYDKFDAGLAAIEVLFRKRAVGWNELSESALKTLIHLEDRFSTDGFETTVYRSIVAIVVGQPAQLAPFLGEKLFGRNIAMKQRYLIMSTLIGAAKELTGVEQSDEKIPSPYKEYDVSKASSSKSSQPDWMRVVSDRVRAKTRHFTVRPAGESGAEQRKTTENRFARVADRFILPLLRSKVGEHLDLTGRDIPLLVRILYCACELLSLAENSPAVVRIALSLTASVESLRYHEEPAVREVVVAAYFSAATVLPEETLALECKSWLQYCIDRMNDEEEGERGRRLAEETSRVVMMRLRLDQGGDVD